MLEERLQESKMNADCASGFQFSGAVDPNASFEEADEIKVSTKFTLNTLSPNQATNGYEKLDTDYADSVVKVKAAP